jgi:hypothetical protein
MSRIDKYIPSVGECLAKYGGGVLATQIFVIKNYGDLRTDRLYKEEKEELADLFNISEASFMTQFSTMMKLARYVQMKDGVIPVNTIPKPLIGKSLVNGNNYRDLTKNEAKELCRGNGFSLNGKVTFASVDKGFQYYWANPDIRRLQCDWWLLLSDYSHRELHVFYIPANSIEENQVIVRSDMTWLIDFNIIYKDDLFEDSRSGIQFVKWFKKTISY